MADYASQLAALQAQKDALSKEYYSPGKGQFGTDSSNPFSSKGDMAYGQAQANIDGQIAAIQAQQSAEANRSAQDKAEDDQVAAAGDFVGFDKTGNAVYNKNGQYSAFNPNDFSRTINNLKADPNNQNKSYESYVGENQFKNLGDYQGIDKESGSAVFKKDGQYSGFGSSDFGELNDYIKNQKMTQQWLNPDYENQFNAAKAAGTSFEGFDSEGNEIAKDALGHYQKVGDPNSGFAKFAKYNLADQKFAGPVGEANTVAGENQNAAAPVAGQQRAIAQNAQSNIAQRMPFQNRGGSYSKFAQSNAPSTDSSSGQQTSGVEAQTSSPAPTPAKDSAPVTAAPQSTPAQAAPISTASAVLSGDTAKQAASPKAPTAMTNVFSQPSLFDTAKQAAVNAGQNAATNYASQATGINAQQAISNPAAYARQMALQQASAAAKNQAASLGVDTSALGDTSKILTNPADYAKSAAAAAIAKQYGFDPQAILDPTKYAENLAGQQASDAIGFNPVTALNNPVQFAQDQVKQQALASLSDQIGFPITAQALQDPIGFAKSAGLSAAKTQALTAAASQLGAADPTGTASMLSGGLNAGSQLLNGGLNQNSANAAGQAAARAALAYFGGGVVNPEMAQAAAGLTDQAAGKLGTAGILLKPTSVGLNLGANVMNGGINAAGNLAAGDFNAANQGVGGLKQITKGDVLGGTTSIAKALANFGYGNAIKAPVSIAKNVVSSVGSAISHLFCFDGDTEILMADDKYKKIKDISIGDAVALGGKVTAIGEALSSTLYKYNGVYVSKGHAVFEDGVWKRIGTTDNEKNLHIKKETIVFPMATENHLIVTEGTVWSDLSELDDTYNYTEDERLEQLNNQKQTNKMLRIYVKNKFVQK